MSVESSLSNIYLSLTYSLQMKRVINKNSENLYDTINSVHQALDAEKKTRENTEHLILKEKDEDFTKLKARLQKLELDQGSDILAQEKRFEIRLEEVRERFQSETNNLKALLKKQEIEEENRYQQMTEFISKLHSEMNVLLKRNSDNDHLRNNEIQSSSAAAAGAIINQEYIDSKLLKIESMIRKHMSDIANQFISSRKDQESLSISVTEIRAVLSAEINSRRMNHDQQCVELDKIILKLDENERFKSQADEICVRIKAVESGLAELASSTSNQIGSLQSSTREVIGYLRQELNNLNNEVQSFTSDGMSNSSSGNSSVVTLINKFNNLEHILSRERVELRAEDLIPVKQAVEENERRLNKWIRKHEKKITEIETRLSNQPIAQSQTQSQQIPLAPPDTSLVAMNNNAAMQRSFILPNTSANINTSFADRITKLEEHFVTLSELHDVSARLAEDEQTASSLKDNKINKRFEEHEMALKVMSEETNALTRHIEERLQILERIQQSLIETQSKENESSNLITVTPIASTPSQDLYEEYKDKILSDVVQRFVSKESLQLYEEGLKRTVEEVNESILKHTSDTESKLLHLAKEEVTAVRQFVIDKLKEERKLRDKAISDNSAKLHSDLAEVLMELETKIGGTTEDTAEEASDNEGES